MKKLIAIVFCMISVAVVHAADQMFGPVTPVPTQKIMTANILKACSEYVDQKIAAVEAKISETGSESSTVISNVTTQIEAVTDAVASNKVELTEAVSEVTPITYHSSAFGFNTNLRTGQVVNNTLLVDTVIAARDKKLQILKAGDYRMVISKFIEANDPTVGPVKGFAGTNADMSVEGLAAALTEYATTGTLPQTGVTTESVIFVAVGGKTYQFYKNN